MSSAEADGSLGNVIAANAIGVFLGLGFPYLVAAVYWWTVNPAVGFVVPSESVSFMVSNQHHYRQHNNLGYADNEG